MNEEKERLIRDYLTSCNYLTSYDIDVYITICKLWMMGEKRCTKYSIYNFMGITENILKEYEHIGESICKMAKIYTIITINKDDFQNWDISKTTTDLLSGIEKELEPNVPIKSIKGVESLLSFVNVFVQYNEEEMYATYYIQNISALIDLIVNVDEFDMKKVKINWGYAKGE